MVELQGYLSQDDLKYTGYKFTGDNIQIDNTIRVFGDRSNLILSQGVRIDAYVTFYVERPIVISANAHIASHCHIRSHEDIWLGSDSVLSAGVCLWTSTDCPNSEKKRGIISVGQRVVIGCNSVVLPGVGIGDDAFVGALSMVNRDIARGEIVGGVPVKHIRWVEGYGNG